MFANIAKQCQGLGDYKKAINHRRTGQFEHPPLSVQSGIMFILSETRHILLQSQNMDRDFFANFPWRIHSIS